MTLAVRQGIGGRDNIKATVTLHVKPVQSKSKNETQDSGSGGGREYTHACLCKPETDFIKPRRKFGRLKHPGQTCRLRETRGSPNMLIQFIKNARVGKTYWLILVV